jgi:hypothetical protein
MIIISYILSLDYLLVTDNRNVLHDYDVVLADNNPLQDRTYAILTTRNDILVR